MDEAGEFLEQLKRGHLLKGKPENEKNFPLPSQHEILGFGRNIAAPGARVDMLQNALLSRMPDRMLSQMNQQKREYPFSQHQFDLPKPSQLEQKQYSSGSSPFSKDSYDIFIQTVVDQREHAGQVRADAAKIRQLRSKETILRETISNLPSQVSSQSTDLAREVQTTAIMNDLWDSAMEESWLIQGNEALKDRDWDRLFYAPKIWQAILHTWNAQVPAGARFMDWTVATYCNLIRVVAGNKCFLCRDKIFHGAGLLGSYSQCPVLQNEKVDMRLWLYSKLKDTMLPGYSLPRHVKFTGGMDPYNTVQTFYRGSCFGSDNAMITQVRISTKHVFDIRDAVHLLAITGSARSDELIRDHQIPNVRTETGKATQRLSLYSIRKEPVATHASFFPFLASFIKVVPLFSVHGLESYFPQKAAARLRESPEQLNPIHRVTIESGEWFHVVSTYNQFRAHRHLTLPEDIQLLTGTATVDLHELYRVQLAPVLDLMQDWGQERVPGSVDEFLKFTIEDLFVPIAVLQMTRFQYECEFVKPVS